VKSCLDCFYYDICVDNTFEDACQDFTSVGGDEALEEYINEERYKFYNDWFQYSEYSDC